MAQRRGYIRPTQWRESIQGEVSLASDTREVVNLLSQLATRDLNGSTITRLIGKIRVHPLAVTTFVELFWGIAIIDSDAFSAGVGSVPDAAEANDADWMVHGWLATRSSDLSDGSQDDVVNFDIRSQRTLHGTHETFVLLFQSSASGISVNRSHFIRTLVKLP